MTRSGRGWLDPAIGAALAGAAVLVLAVGLGALYEQWRGLRAGDQARETIRVLQQIGRVKQLVTEAESGQRGYLITGDGRYLRPYDRALQAIPPALERLRTMTGDNPNQQAELDALEPLIAAKLEELRLTVGLVTSGDNQAVQDILRSGLGKTLTRRIRSHLDTAAREQRIVSREHLARRGVRIRNTRWLILLGSLLSLALMSLAAGALTTLLRRAQAAEQRTRESEEHLRITLRSIGDAVIATDTAGRIVFMNPIAEDLTGWREVEARAQPLGAVFRTVDPETREPLESPDAAVVRDRLAVGLDHHAVLVGRDGREFRIDHSAAPIRSAEGSFAGVVVAFRDVSQREAAEAEHRRALLADAARTEAERANQAKDAFLAVLSHELRSPLSAMLAWLGILQRRGDEPAMRARAIAVLERGVRTQTQLINDLLDVSRIASGKLRVDRAQVNLAAVLPATLDGLQPAAEAKGVTLVRMLPGDPVPVSGDEARLEQVVRNLVENAIKFTPAGGRVTVSLAEVAGEAVIRVEDTGEGFQPEARAAIFDRYHQSPGPLARRHGGLGLGLAIVRHLVEEHGGTVSADSPGPGRGATLTVSLPLARREELGGPRAAGPGGPGARLRGMSVLLVDDDADWRQALALGLAHAGAQVTAAGSVAEAMAALDAHTPHVLVSDIGMPDADGYELIRRVREARGGSLRAVAMTGLTDADTRERCLRQGFDDFLVKPFEPDQLVAALAGAREA